jgi:hypothetical protein
VTRQADQAHQADFNDTLFLAMELSRATWLVATFAPRQGNEISVHAIPGGRPQGRNSRVCTSAARKTGDAPADGGSKLAYPSAREGPGPLEIAAGRPTPKKAPGMEAVRPKPAAGSVHDSPTEGAP